MPYRVLACLLLLGTLARGSAAAPAASTTETFSLSNALTVVLRKIPGAPTAVVAVVYRIGSDHDPKGACGMANLVEGTYLTAATTARDARSPDLIEARPPPGAADAPRFEHGTADDHTFFARVLLPAEIAGELEDVAQRMGALRVVEADLAKARERLTEQLERSYAGIPETASRLRARERLVEAPNGGRRLGRVSDVKSMTLVQVQDRLSRFYKARNAVLAVEGDFDVLAVRALVRKRFATVASGEEVPAPGERAPAPTGSEWDGVGEGPAIFAVAARSQVVPGAVTLAVLAPRQGAASRYAAFLLLVTRLLDRAAEAGSGGGASAPQPSYDPYGDPEVLYVTLTLPEGTSVRQAAQQMHELLVDVVRSPVGPTDAVHARARLNGWFGLPVPDGAPSPDLVQRARGDARRAQTGLDGDALLRFVVETKTDELRLSISRPHRVAAAIPKR